MRLSYNAYFRHRPDSSRREALRLLHGMLQALQNSSEHNEYKRSIAACLASMEEELIRGRAPDYEQFGKLLQIVGASKEFTCQTIRFTSVLHSLSLAEKV
jgi:hypothetical protein